jgi:hypothetical protein
LQVIRAYLQVVYSFSQAPDLELKRRWLNSHNYNYLKLKKEEVIDKGFGLYKYSDFAALHRFL